MHFLQSFRDQPQNQGQCHRTRPSYVFLPYEETVLGSEAAKNILFVAYPSNRGGYAIKTVPKSLEDHTSRMSFPEEWAGLEGDEVQKVSGIPGLSFCHSTRFLVSCKDLDSVYQVFSKIL